MPKNKGKGGKNRKRGKNENFDDIKRELIYKDVGQDYAQVTRMLGGGNVEALCFTDGKRRVCHIRGKLHKKVWINNMDVILIGLRNYEDDKADVIMKYTIDEARKLQKLSAIPRNINLAEATVISQDQENDNVYFGENENGSESEGDDDDVGNKETLNGNLNRNNRLVKVSDNSDDDDDDDGEKNEEDDKDSIDFI